MRKTMAAEMAPFMTIEYNGTKVMINIGNDFMNKYKPKNLMVIKLMIIAERNAEKSLKKLNFFCWFEISVQNFLTINYKNYVYYLINKRSSNTQFIHNWFIANLESQL
jgi:hypothetical protein